MDDIIMLADQISGKMKDSDLYRDYVNAYNRIKNNKELMERISKIKREHIDFAGKYKEGNHDFEREKYISQEFYKLMLDKDVETYFMNEHKLVRLISTIYDTISTNCILKVFD